MGGAEGRVAYIGKFFQTIDRSFEVTAVLDTEGTFRPERSVLVLIHPMVWPQFMFFDTMIESLRSLSVLEVWSFAEYLFDSYEC